MTLLFLTGIFRAVDGFALQDFETQATGDITVSEITWPSPSTNNGLSFTTAQFIQRT